MKTSLSRIAGTVLLSLPVLLGSGCQDDRVTYTDPVEVHPGTEGLPQEIAMAQQEVQNQSYDAAETRLGTWLEGNQGHAYEAEAYYWLGKAQAEGGNNEVAVNSFGKCVKKAPDRTTKGKGILARADANYKLGKYNEASRNYHILEQIYRDVRGVAHDEVMFKLGLCHKMANQPQTADYWFAKVFEMYAHGRYAKEARILHSNLGPGQSGETTYYSLEMGSFGDEDKALAEAELYRNKGYRDVEVKEYSMMGATYYSVQVGKYFNKNDAKRALDDAELSGLQASIRPMEFKVFK